VTAQPARAYLDDPVVYADMIDALDRGTADIVAQGPDGVLLLGPDATAMLAAADPGSAQAMLDRLDPAGLREVVVHDRFALPLVRARYGFTRTMVCRSAAYLGGPLATRDRPDWRVETLSTRWEPVVAAHYHLGGPGYVLDRLRGGHLVGAFAGQQLLGFIGQHAQGALGLLVVLPQHRRQGLAEFLLTHSVNQLLDQGRTPYDHIEAGNQASQQLQRKLGFSISAERLAWVSP
jgi:GNAT superfamily N-acetyltransferase